MVYDVAVLDYLQLKMWVCLFTKHVLFKVEKCSSFAEDIVIFILFTNNYGGMDLIELIDSVNNSGFETKTLRSNN